MKDRLDEIWRCLITIYFKFLQFFTTNSGTNLSAQRVCDQIVPGFRRLADFLEKICDRHGS